MEMRTGIGRRGLVDLSYLLVAMRKLWFGLLFFSVAVGELNLVPDRLRIDGVFVGYGGFYQGQTKGWSKTGFNFQWRLGKLGLTANIIENASTRVDFDLCAIVLRDLFLEFRLPSGFKIRAGQFSVPLSFEAETDEMDLKLEEYSILYGTVIKPNTVRDVGLLLTWTQAGPAPGLRAMAGAVQGTGPNSVDNNSQKDVFCRVVVNPWSELNLSLGARGYYGWVNPEAVPWLGLGAEAVFKPGDLFVRTELAFRRHQNIPVPAGQIETSYQLGFLEPALRGEAMRWDDGRLRLRVLLGLMMKPAAENLKVLIGYQYHTQWTVWTHQSLIVQLIAGF